MWKNYFKIAWRNLLRNKAFTVINICGLVIGMTLAVLLLLWVQYEFTYDQFHAKKDRLYEVYHQAVYDGNIGTSNFTPQPLAPVLEANYPEVLRSARTTGMDLTLNAGERQLDESVIVIDPAFLDMFDFPLVKGDLSNVFDSPLSIVLTEELASKLFGHEDPIGRAISLNGEADVMVTGVLKDLPPNTKFHIEALLPWSLLKLMEYESDFWGNNSVQTYVELHPETNVGLLDRKIKDVIRVHSDVEADILLHPLDKWHLYSRFENGVQAGGRITIVNMLCTIAGIALLIACINFMNLSTARSEKRAKEVGIRKVSGGDRSSLISQFLMESILIASISGILSLVLVGLLLPSFNAFTDQQIDIPFDASWFWIGYSGIVLLTGILAGSYPAFFLSSFRPIGVLNGVLKPTKSSFTLRQILVIAQFAFATVSIAATIIVHQQYQHALKREIGYDKDQLVYISYYGGIKDNFSAFREELLQSNAVSSISRTLSPFSEGYSSGAGVEWPGKSAADRTVFDYFSTDADLVRTAGLELLEGRDIDIFAFPSDSSSMLLNETAVKAMGLADPIGQKIRHKINHVDREWEVVGVIRDFVLRSPFEKTAPMVIHGPHFWHEIVHLRLNSDRGIKENLEKIEAVAKKYNGDVNMAIRFVDEEYAGKFHGAERTADLATVFCMVTIFISCMGLFGLASFMAEQRQKEIGIRKVLGSSVTAIMILLSTDFIKLVLIAMVVALPVSWYAMKIFLRGFSYRIEPEWYHFVLTGVATLLIALLTVSFQAIRAAVANPVESLRSE
jgi:putative ABC transport system permease protein